MQTLKAIETVYRGYRFRSRLEARWAVFFDALGLKWEYEKEGYDLGPAGLYLPDFWLVDVKMWAEVKPSREGDDQVKCVALACATGFACLLLDGPPTYKEYWAGEAEGEIGYLLTDEYIHDEHRFFSSPSGDEWASANTLHAYVLARSARFEHGEVPDVHAFVGYDGPETAECTRCGWRRRRGDNDGW